MSQVEPAVTYTSELPEDFTALLELYETLGWNFLNLDIRDLQAMCAGSWYSVYAYEGERLVGMGRVISDGVLTGLLCGICVHPDVQARGIGTGIVQRLVMQCEKFGVIPQLLCEQELEGYYERLGFTAFTIGMKKHIAR
ncbi:GNAT family N-acetyltransferase [Paenibacillus lactis]|uniref:GNAT family N-acetyltransferase n=1 Tax=Paenibacillus lactis TaxID=228574 RepID=UPI002042480C|nr:GNAT family N-acetyltransferase [Paenibacillus lactis]MCM3496427.1 GNAT family N-acetyltransferase [Paenibacillus lactis]